MAGTAVIYQLIARDGASAVFNRVGRSADGMNSKMAKVAKVAAGVGIALVGLGAGAAEAADKAAEFQSSMTKIQTQAGASAKDVATLSKQVLKLAPATQQGPQQLSEALYHLKSVGMDNAKAMKALKTASDLAAVGGANLEDTTNALAGAWRTGIKGATSFGDAASTVNAIIGAGNMSMEDFTDALSSGILPTAKTFGLTMKQVGAALALFTDEGVPANSAATRLRMSISLLGAPSGAAEKQLKKIGLTGLDLANAMRGKNGIIGAIQLLKDHLDASGLSASEQSQILSRAFGGGKSSSAILSMVNNLDVLKQKQDQVNSSTGKYADAVQTQRKTAEAQWKILTSSLETLTIQLGVKLLPPITSFFQFLSQKALPAALKVGGAIGNLIPLDKIKTNVSQAAGIVSGFLDGIGATGALSKAKDSLTGALGLDRAKAPKAYKAQPTDSPHAGSGKTAPYNLPIGPALTAAPHLGAANVGVPASGPALTAPPHLGSGNVAPLVPAKPPKALSQGQQLAKTFTSAISNINWGKLGELIGTGLATAIGAAAKAAGKLVAAFGKLLTSIDWVGIGISLGKEVPSLLVGLVAGILNFDLLGLLKGLGKHWQDILWAVLAVAFTPAKWLGKIGELLVKIPFIGKLLAWGLDAFGKFSKGLVKWVGDALGFLGKAFMDGFRRVFPGVGEGLDTALRLLPTRLGVMAIELVEKGLAIAHSIGDGILSGISWVVAKIGELTATILKPFASAGSWLISKGAEILRGLGSGIATGAKAVGGWAKRWMIDPLVSRFAAAGSWLLSKGSALVSGLKNGVVNGAKAIGSWIISHVVSPVVSRFAAAGSWLLSRGSQLISGLKDGVVNGAKSIALWMFNHVAVPLTSRFSAAKSWLLSRGGQLISGLKNGIIGAIKGVNTWVKSHIVDPVVNAVKHFFGIHSPSTVFAGIGGHLVSGLIKGLATTNGPAIVHRIFGSMPSALASIVGKGLVHISSLPGKAMKALGGLGGKLGGLLGGIFGGGGGGGGKGGVSQWAGDVQAVLAMLGAPSSALSAVLTRIGIESGGNPKAINLWDSNAAAGHPSQGLMQTIPGTFNAYAGPFKSRGITDPLASIYAGVNYAMHRYGKNWISVMTRPGGYDEGGLANHKGVMLKNTNRPERVLSPRQTVAFEQLVALLGHANTGGGNERPIHVHVHVDDPTLKDLIRIEVDNGLDELGTALGVTG